jgi:cysteine sulfinate desulfinase/cysteine desulfurase-like protein
MGKAAELAGEAVRDANRVARLRDRLERGIMELVPDAVVNGDVARRLPNTSNVILPGLRGESLVVALDQHGIALSSGSACKSGSPEPTHVLIAMGKPAEDVHCSVRFSLSRETTQEDVEGTVAALRRVLQELETTVRFLPCK